MVGLLDKKVLRSFVTGHWNTYAVEQEEMELSHDYTPSYIFKSLQIFEQSFTVEKHVFALEDLICIILTLEEIETKKARKMMKTKAKVGKRLKTSQFKFAFSEDESLLFCNRVISRDIRDQLGHVFHAESFIPLDLSGSPPLELLKLHREAKGDTSATFSVLMDMTSMDHLEENKPFKKNEIFLKIGSEPGQPQIKRLSCVLENVKLHTDDSDVKDIVMKNVSVDLSGPSLFDLYCSLAEKDVIKSVPEWVEACRKRGLTHRKVVYT